MDSNNGGGKLNGFMLGALVGGLVVFAVGTQKGRKILKALTEEGLEGVSDLMEEYKEAEEELENEPVVVEPKEKPKKESKLKDEAVEADVVEEAPAAETPKSNGHKNGEAKKSSGARRFFKRGTRS